MEKLFNNFFANVRKIIAPGIVCTLLFAVVSCNASKEPSVFDDDEATNVSFSEFSLSENCQWIDIVKSTENAIQWMNSGKMIIINSNEELKKYIECLDNNYPDIDFSKYTLLLTSGVTPNLVYRANINSFAELSANKYRLNIEVLMTDATMIGSWTTAILVKKLSVQSEIELNVTIKN